MNHKPLVIAIDYDDTLHDTKNIPPGRKLGPPLPGAQQALRNYKLLGHTIIIHTVHSTSSHIEQWLKYFNIPYDEVTNIKPNADFFIDDRAIHFTSWKDMPLL